MNPWIELDRQSAALQPWQLVLMLVFLLGYAGMIGGLLSPRGRWRAAVLAALSGIGLCVLTAPWVLGALMLALAVGVIGLFVVLSLLMSRLLGLDRQRATAPLADESPASPRPPRVRSGGPATVT